MRVASPDAIQNGNLSGFEVEDSDTRLVSIPAVIQNREQNHFAAWEGMGVEVGHLSRVAIRSREPLGSGGAAHRRDPDKRSQNGTGTEVDVPVG